MKISKPPYTLFYLFSFPSTNFETKPLLSFLPNKFQNHPTPPSTSYLPLSKRIKTKPAKNNLPIRPSPVHRRNVHWSLRFDSCLLRFRQPLIFFIPQQPSPNTSRIQIQNLVHEPGAGNWGFESKASLRQKATKVWKRRAFQTDFFLCGKDGLIGVGKIDFSLFFYEKMGVFVIKKEEYGKG